MSDPPIKLHLVRCRPLPDGTFIALEDSVEVDARPEDLDADVWRSLRILAGHGALTMFTVFILRNSAIRMIPFDIAVAEAAGSAFERAQRRLRRLLG